MGVESAGNALRETRVARGLALSEVAKRLKVSKGYLSRVESGKSKPSRKLLSKISKVLALDEDAVLVAAGYIPTDLVGILHRHPTEAPAVLRETFGSYSPTAVAEEGGTESGSSRERRNQSGLYEIVRGDCFVWMAERMPNSVEAVVTDPPYGLKEYTPLEQGKLRRGRGGVWRIPPKLDGYARSPLPRFTVLDAREREALGEFFRRWGELAFRVLVPGGHVFIATNPLLSHIVYKALEESGLEKRGEIIRLVQTLRGGDRPKNAHKEFNDVSVMPRSGWEPWGLFRKPCEGRVQDNLRKWRTGGLRRVSEAQPFSDVVKSSPTRGLERGIAPHPSLKPQGFMRQIVRASLPLGEGTVLDPFMGAGSTVAAAVAVGYKSIGIEIDSEFFRVAQGAIPRLASISENGNGTLPVESGPSGGDGRQRRLL